MPEPVRGATERYLARVDAALPGRVVGFYIVGSTALGAFRPGRSDIDFVAVVDDRGLDAAEIRRLRNVHRRTSAADTVRTIGRFVGRGWRWPMAVNGVYVRSGDLRRPATEVAGVAAHVGYEFHDGGGFDVNPVTWRTLASKGIAVRGDDPARLGIPFDDDTLRRWTRDNLDKYWRWWADAVRRRPPTGPALKARLRHMAAWGVLGAPRLHFTIATGDVASKEEAGEYALEVFDREWHPIIREGLAYWRGQPPAPEYRSPARRRQEAADFVEAVVTDVVA